MLFFRLPLIYSNAAFRHSHATTTPTMAAPPPIPLDYLVVLDLEAYCDNPADPHGPEIVEFPFLVYDLLTRTVVDHKQIYITPKWSANPNPPPEVVHAFGIDVAFAPSLADALAQFDAYVFQSFLGSRKSFYIVTDGHWDVTHYLYFEAARKAVMLNAYFRVFFDLRVEFCKCYPAAPVPPDRNAMFEFLNVPPPARGSGVDECIGLAALITRLLRDGHRFTQPEVVTDGDWNSVVRVPAIATPVAAAAPVGAVIRLRGLPWVSSERDVEKFLEGIPIVPRGIHFVRDAQGKATGEAFVQLETADAVSAALARHKRSVGPRYIEVFRSSPVDMANHLRRADARRQLYTGAVATPPRLRSGGARGRGNRSARDGAPRFVVKVSGLPADASHDDVALLMEGVQIAGEGLHVILNSDGFCVGDAFVEVASDAHLKKAISRAGTSLPIARAAEADNARYVTVDVRKSSLAQLRAAIYGAESGNGGAGRIGSGGGGGGSGGGNNGGAMGKRNDRGRRVSLSGSIGSGNGGTSGNVSDHASEHHVHGNGSEYGGKETSSRGDASENKDKFIVTVRNMADTMEVGDVLDLMRGLRISDGDVHVIGASGPDGTERVARVALRSREERDVAMGRSGRTLCGRKAIVEDGAEVGADTGAKGNAAGGKATASQLSTGHSSVVGGRSSTGTSTEVADIDSSGFPTSSAAVTSAVPHGQQLASTGMGMGAGVGAGSSPGTRVVRMRGLPFSADDEDIIRFFAGFRIVDGGIVRGRGRLGRASGEASVTFMSEDEARAAVDKLDKAHMGNRYIELKL